MEILQKLKQLELVNTDSLIIKCVLSFLNWCMVICDYLKFTWKTVPLCTASARNKFWVLNLGM